MLGCLLMFTSISFFLTVLLGEAKPVHAAPAEVVLVEQVQEVRRAVPFYSQFTDVSDPAWKKLACGIASLAMVLEYQTGEKQSVDALLAEGRRSGAYESKNGWIHDGLITLAQKRGLSGAAYNLHASTTVAAFDAFKEKVVQAPTIVSVQYNFNRKSPISHLIVVDRIEDGIVYYNDPAQEQGGGIITQEGFLAAWNKRFIVLQQSTEHR